MSDRRFFEILSIHEAVLLHAMLCELVARRDMAESGQINLRYLSELGRTVQHATSHMGEDGLRLLAGRLDEMVLNFGPGCYTKNPEEANPG